MRANYTTFRTPQFRVLSEDQIEEIHLATLEVLEGTGVKVGGNEAVELLRTAGARVYGKDLVKIPSYLVEQALQSAPPRIVLCYRDGKRTVALENHKVYFGSNASTLRVIDPVTHRMRDSLRQDVRTLALVGDYLPTMDFVQSGRSISDVPARIANLVETEEIFKTTRKPVVFNVLNRQELSEIIDMAIVIAGSYERLAENPFIMTYLEMISPLVHPKEIVEALLLAVEKNIPVVYTPMPLGER